MIDIIEEIVFVFFSSRRRHTRYWRDWSSDVCSSDLIFYVLKSGCPWRLLPHDFPPWSTVYYHFRRFRLSGLWSLILKGLHAAERKRAGKEIPNRRLPSWTPRVSKPSKNRPTRAATTPTRTSKGASATFWWTPWVFHSRFTSLRPTYKIGLGRGVFWPG